MALDTKEWHELYEGAREVFGPARAAIFMKAMEPSLRDDLVTKSDLRAEMADLRAVVESKLRAQTWMMVTVMIAAVGATRFL